MLPPMLSSTNPGALPGIGTALDSHTYDALVKHTDIWSFIQRFVGSMEKEVCKGGVEG